MGAFLSCAGGGDDGVSVLECIWFPDAKMPCRNYQRDGSCKRRNCEYAHQQTSLSRFLKYFAQTRSTLDVAVFTITCNEIAAAVEDCHKRGVKVRIITDDEQMRSTGSDIDSLRRAGIQVRHDANPQYHMHHKFAVFDGHIVATGSFNWTRAAVLHNQENIVMLNGDGVAAQYKSQFDYMWNQFRGNQL